MGFSRDPLAAKPGDDLLFHCLGNSTIGAVRFHGRVRDGIGWVTDAMATKLWDRRIGHPSKHFFDGTLRSSRNSATFGNPLGTRCVAYLAEIEPEPISRAVGDGGTLKREMSN